MQALKHSLPQYVDDQNDEASPNDELPVLNTVVRTGKASIIQSHRLGHRVLDELETLRLVPATAAMPKANTDVMPESVAENFSVLDDLTICVDQTLDFEQPDYATGLDTSFAQRDEEATLSDDELELMVEALIERHVNELRQDIRTLLATARHRP